MILIVVSVEMWLKRGEWSNPTLKLLQFNKLYHIT